MLFSPTGKKAPPRLTIALVSATALAYEILLMRLMSIIQYHHFAYMIISLALLGYGAAGTALALGREWLLKRFDKVFPATILFFSLTLLGCFLIAQRLPFNPEEIIWDVSQVFVLFLLYLLLALPFFFGAAAVALALAKFRKDIAKIYSADLFGAGLGSFMVIGLLFLVFPAQALKVLASLAMTAVFCGCLETRVLPFKRALLILIPVALPLLLPASWTELRIMDYKGLSQQMRVAGSKIIKERSSPLGLLSVVESTVIPFRYAPGLSLNAFKGPPAQLGIFTDGNGMTALSKDVNNREDLAYLDQITSALPYHLATRGNVLIIGAGGGSDINQARYHGVGRIDVVELNPQMVDLVREDFKDFSGDVFDPADTAVYIGDGRGFVAKSKKQYDLIQVPLLDSFGASAAGLYALNENYLYTIEAFQEFIRHLKPEGYLAVSRWIKLPPRDTLKMFATAVEALKREGIAGPGKHLALVRSWQTSTLLIKKGALTPIDIGKLTRFSETRGFDVAYYPGIKRTATNRHNILQKAYFYEAALSILGSTTAFFERYKFNIQPAMDDRPYFAHFFKWRVLPEILALRGRGGMILFEAGYFILVATLIQAVVASIVLILLPLFWKARITRGAKTHGQVGATFFYFSAIGLAFLFLEIAFIQKFILFLSRPLYAVAVVLASFLVFAGLGSRYSTRMSPLSMKFSIANPLVLPVVGIAALAVHYLALLGPLFHVLTGWPDAAKIVLSVILIAPLAFCMGMPFPIAMTRLGEGTEQLIPWAWGVNGCASVVSAVLATLLAIHFGFSAVVIAAVLLYCFAAAVLPKSVKASV